MHAARNPASSHTASIRQRDLERLREDGGGGVEFDVEEFDNNNADEEEEQFFPPEEVLDNIYIPEDDDDEDEDLSPFERLSKKMEDLSGDGGVKKRILQPGEGNVVTPESIVRVHYNAFLEYADEPFDSTRLRNQIERYKLGKGELIPGLEIAVSSMKKGELSQILIQPDYAFGKLGITPRIPPNATIMFKLELLNFVDHAGLEDYDVMTQEERDKVPFSDILKLVEQERQLGLQLYREKTFNKAFSHYKRAAVILENRNVRDEQEDKVKEEKLATLFTNMAVCASKQNKFGMVLKYCRSGRQYSPNNVKLLFLQGKAHRKCSNFEQSRDFLKRAQRMSPNSSEINHELQELDKDIKRFSEIEKDMYGKMFSKPTGQTDADAGKESEKAKQKEDDPSKVSDEFEKLVEKKLLEFINDNNQDDMPFPCYNLTPAEIACIMEKCDNLGLDCKTVGTGSNFRLKIVKKEK